MTTLLSSPWEHAARAFEDPHAAWRTPGDIARRLDPNTVQTPALDLIDDALARLVDTPDGRLIITLAPQEGKSTRVAKHFPIWALRHNPDTRVVTASYAQGLANRNGRAIRNAIASHPEIGLRIAQDNGSASEWQIEGHQGGVVSVGIGAGLTGRPADLLVIDDPVKDRKEADSKLHQEAVWDWWTDVAATRLAPGAPVVVILTRWHEKDLAGRMLAAEDGHLWEVLNIPAQADHDPEEGEVDPLGREPGEFMESARGRTTEQWEAIKLRSGSRTWASLYQGHPTVAGGTFFQRGWWRTYHQPQWIERPDGTRWVTAYDDLLISWDMAFKGTAGSDRVVGQVWMRRGADAYLLDQVAARMDFPATLAAFRQLAARWPQAVLKLVEDKANGPAAIAMLSKPAPGQPAIGGIVPEEPHGGKEVRAAAVSPLVEAGNAWLPAPELAPWVGEFLDETAGFPSAANDDVVDAATQALNRLLLLPLISETDTVTEDELDDELADYSITPY